MIEGSDDVVKYKSARPIEDVEKRAARREWYKGQPWRVEVELAIADRERYRGDLEAAAACAPERTRNFIAGAEWALAGIAIVAALQSVQGSDENGTRRAVPVSGKFLADLLVIHGFCADLKTETVDRYAKLLLNLLVESKRLALVREAKRVSGDKGDGDSREWLVYVGGREFVECEPHAEPRCWKKPKVAEQPREPREQRSEPEAPKLVPANPHEPTEEARQFKANDQAFCAETKFRAAGEKHRTKLADERRAATTRGTTASGTVTAKPQNSEPRPPQGVNWIVEIASGRVSIDAATTRLRETVSDNDECRSRAVFLDCDARERKR